MKFTTTAKKSTFDDADGYLEIAMTCVNPAHNHTDADRALVAHVGMLSAENTPEGEDGSYVSYETSLGTPAPLLSSGDHEEFQGLIAAARARVIETAGVFSELARSTDG